MAISITSDYDDGTPGPTAQGAIGQSGEGPEAPILRRTRRQSAGSGPHTSPGGDSPAISPPPYCTEFEYGDFLAPGPRRQYVVVLRNGPLRSRCYYLTGLYLLFICPTCLVIALELQ